MLSKYKISHNVIVRNRSNQAVFQTGTIDRVKYGTTVYKITDAQFSKTKTSLFGFLPQSYTKKTLKVRSGGFYLSIPITEKQLQQKRTYTKGQ